MAKGAIGPARKRRSRRPTRTRSRSTSRSAARCRRRMAACSSRQEVGALPGRAARAARPFRDAERAVMIRVGIGGWTYEPWRGTFYPDRPEARRRAPLRRAQAHLDRDQRHLLPDAVGGELRQVARRDAGRFRLRGEGPPRRGQQEGARRGRRGDRLVLQVAASRELGDKLGPLLWQFAPFKKFDAGRLRRLPRAPAGEGRRADAPPRRRGALRRASSCRSSWRSSRKHNVAVVFADSDDYPTIADVTADFVYARLQKARGEDRDRLSAARPRPLGEAGEDLGGRRRARRPAALRHGQGRRRRSATSSST